MLNPAAASNFSLQLPGPAALLSRAKVHLVNGNGNMANGSCYVTLVRAGTEKINGLAADYVLDAPFGRWMVVSDGTDWYVF